MAVFKHGNTFLRELAQKQPTPRIRLPLHGRVESFFPESLFCPGVHAADQTRCGGGGGCLRSRPLPHKRQQAVAFWRINGLGHRQDRSDGLQSFGFPRIARKSGRFRVPLPDW